MKIRTAILVFIIMSIFVSSAFAEVSIKAEVDKKVISTDEVLTYKLTITSSENNIPVPNMPKLEGFAVISNAQSSTVSFGKGGAKSIVVYAFILKPLALGKFKIGPTTIKIKDKIYVTDSFEIEVKQGNAKLSPPANKEKSSSPDKELPESKTPQYSI